MQIAGGHPNGGVVSTINIAPPDAHRGTLLAKQRFKNKNGRFGCH